VKKKRVYDSLMIYITDKCNRKCSDCFVSKTPFELTVSRAVEIAEIIGGVKDLYISGGEPTCHSEFEEIVAQLSMIQHERMILATNGYKIMEYVEVLEIFDDIRISNYTETSYRNSSANIFTIEKFKKAFKGNARIYVNDKSVMLEPNSNKKPCGRENNGIVALRNDKIYGCCVGAGIDKAKSASFSIDWRDEASKLKLPCKKCVFAINKTK